MLPNSPADTLSVDVRTAMEKAANYEGFYYGWKWTSINLIEPAEGGTTPDHAWHKRGATP